MKNGLWVSWKAFLSSSHNNQIFIENHHTAVKCTGGANTMVVSTVLDYAYTGDNVELIIYFGIA